MTKILTVFTGGTIGSINGANGLHPATPHAQVETILSMVSAKVPKGIELTPIQPINVLSEVMHPKDWEVLHGAISKSLTDHDGILILHGTDTLAYTAASIAFNEHLSKRVPVVLTGANLPMSSPESDAPANISHSLITLNSLIESKKTGAFVVFTGDSAPNAEGKIFLASRVKKFIWMGHCYRNFNMGNRDHVGKVSSRGDVTIDETVWDMFSSDIAWPNFHAHFAYEKVDFFKIAPGLNPRHIVNSVNSDDVTAIILEIYNSGTAPTNGLGSLEEALRLAQKNKKIIFAVSQHEGAGGMTMDKYETSLRLRDLGVIPLGSMMWESAIPKLMLATANLNSAENVISYMKTNIAGEYN